MVWGKYLQSQELFQLNTHSFRLFSGLKSYYVISYFGCAICIAGEVLRKTAMLNAGTNFNHLVCIHISILLSHILIFHIYFSKVQYEKAEDHVLVTSGVYSLFRHPSYVGWFYWSIGTQVSDLGGQFSSQVYCILVVWEI